MIKYQLICELSHEFEGWFQTSAAFDSQSQSELITCPVCGSANVRREFMTPNLASPKRRQKPPVDNISNTKRPLPVSIVRHNHCHPIKYLSVMA